MAIKTGMGSFLIVELQPRAESGTAVVGVGIGDGIGPFAQHGLNHTFGFAVSLRVIRSGAFSADTKPAAGFANNTTQDRDDNRGHGNRNAENSADRSQFAGRESRPHGNDAPVMSPQYTQQ